MWNSPLDSARKRIVELEEKTEEVTQMVAQSHEKAANTKPGSMNGRRTQPDRPESKH